MTTPHGFPRSGFRVAMIACAVAGCLAGRAPRADDAAGTGDLATFLAEKGIDRAGRGAIETATAWDDPVEQAVVRVLLRLPAPAELEDRWRADAIDIASPPPAVGDRLVAVRGRAVFVARQPLAPGQRQLAAGRTHLDVVRVVDPAGTPVDVVLFEAPRAWARGRAIDEPTAVFGLPLSTSDALRPAGATDWPAAAPALVMAAPSMAWFPATPLAAAGMDYALFDAVTDGRKLEGGDSAAFFAMLTAVGSMPDAPPGRPTDIVPLIDPSQKWFASHRGDPVTIAGVLRRATRIAIDEPVRRAQIGSDHYWELFVFVPTPPLNVDGNLQDSFPIVCCVRELPAGMPTGDRISESVVVPGFALKRYAYPLADAVIGDEVRKASWRETPLVVGRRADWQPRPSTDGAGNLLFGVFAALAAAVAAALAWGTWSMRRDARQAEARARAELPETFRLPGDRD